MKGIFVLAHKKYFLFTLIAYLAYFSHIHGAEVAESKSASIPPELRNLPYGVYPDSPEYNTERLIFNKRFVYFPKAIFNPTTYAEIQFVLSSLKAHRLDFAIRSGGHCHEPGSLSSDYIIDLGAFNNILVDTSNKTAFIGAGARLGNVITTLGQSNNAIPTGTCPTVGVSGLALGGGIGLLCRQFGLTCDSVKSITLLNADAQIIEVNESQYSDLFWALRGGGNGSYGIVLGWTFNIHYIPEASFYELIWEWSPDLIIPLIHAWQDWIDSLSPQISSVLAIRHPNEFCSVPHNSPPLVIRIFGLKIGSEPFVEWKCAFKKFHPHVNIFTGSYGDLSKYWATETSLPFNKVKSCILCEPLKENTTSLINEFFERLEEKDINALIYFELEAFGGAVADGHTAFFPRKAFGWWLQAYYWPEQKQSAELLEMSREFYSQIPNHIKKYCYTNIVDYDLGPSYLERYYGDHVEKLECIKEKYDPTNLFHWHQSIPLPQNMARTENLDT